MKTLQILLFTLLLYIGHLPSFGQTINEPITYIVQPKNGLWGIAKKFNVTVEDIKRWNHLTSNDISIGQVLIVGFKNNEIETNSIATDVLEKESLPAETNEVEQDKSIDTKETTKEESPYKVEIKKDTIRDKTGISKPNKSGIEPCLLGEWVSKQECDIYTATPYFFEFRDDGSGKYGITECEHPYHQFIYSFKYSVSGKIISLIDQKEIFGGGKGKFKRDDVLFFVCPEDFILLSGIKYTRK